MSNISVTGKPYSKAKWLILCTNTSDWDRQKCTDGANKTDKITSDFDLGDPNLKEITTDLTNARNLKSRTSKTTNATDF